jgi:peptide/nickel transport system permease protein
MMPEIAAHPGPAGTGSPPAAEMPELLPQSYWDLVWGQFIRNKLALLSMIVIVGLFLLAIWAPILANGKPFVWKEWVAGADGGSLRVTYPLWQYMVAPTAGISVDYLFNYMFFLTLSAPLICGIVWLLSRKRGLKHFQITRRIYLAGVLSTFVALLPFLAPGTYERTASVEERKTNPELTLVKEFRIFRPARLDKRHYPTDRHKLDASKGEAAIFPPIAQDPITPTVAVLEKPTGAHILGTDFQGRDVLARMLHGARISLSVGFVAEGIAVLIGVLIGGLAGYYRGWVDIAISRMIEIVICFPSFFLIITVIAFVEDRSIFHVMLIIGLTSWTGIARLVRGEFLKLREQDFVQAARALGCRGSRVMFTHILPNALGPVLVSAAFGVAGAVLTESSLSYLGFGAPPPTPTWGEMISQGKTHIEEAWWLLFFPGLTIFLTVTVYNLAGDGLRDAMDPKMRK